MEVDLIQVNSPKARKRRNRDEDEDEEHDNFDFDGLPTSRRGPKVGRRVSGVYREIRSLQNIGHNAKVMELVFSRMPTFEMLQAGSASPLWLTVAYHILRRRLEGSSFLRMWRSEEFKQYSPNYLWLNWELHFHDELLGSDEPEGVQDSSLFKAPKIQAIISIGNRTAYGQFTHEDAKLPFREDHIFATCQEAILSSPNLNDIGTVSDLSSSSMIIESLFIPKSNHFTVKGFGLEIGRDQWSPQEVSNKVELDEGDRGANQVLGAVLLLQYNETSANLQFVEQLRNLHPTADILVGDSEEIGCNRIAASDHPSAVGMTFYTGQGATVAVYEIDFSQTNAKDLLGKMKNTADKAKNSLCFLFSHDSRKSVLDMDSWDDDADTDEDKMQEDNGEMQDGTMLGMQPRPSIKDVITEIKKWLYRTPIVGVKSVLPVTAKTSEGNSNVIINSESGREFAFGLLLLTYN